MTADSTRAATDASKCCPTCRNPPVSSTPPPCTLDQLRACTVPTTVCTTDAITREGCCPTCKPEVYVPPTTCTNVAPFDGVAECAAGSVPEFNRDTCKYSCKPPVTTYPCTDAEREQCLLQRPVCDVNILTEMSANFDGTKACCRPCTLVENRCDNFWDYREKCAAVPPCSQFERPEARPVDATGADACCPTCRPAPLPDFGCPACAADSVCRRRCDPNNLDRCIGICIPKEKLLRRRICLSSASDAVKAELAKFDNTTIAEYAIQAVKKYCSAVDDEKCSKERLKALENIGVELDSDFVTRFCFYVFVTPTGEVVKALPTPAEREAGQTTDGEKIGDKEIGAGATTGTTTATPRLKKRATRDTPTADEQLLIDSMGSDVNGGSSGITATVSEEAASGAGVNVVSTLALFVVASLMVLLLA